MDNNYFGKWSCFTSGVSYIVVQLEKKQLELPFRFYVTKVMISQQLL